MSLRPSAAVTKDWVRAMATTQRLLEMPEPTLAAVVHEHAAARGDSPALIGPDETLSYGELSGRANRYARWALSEGLAADDVVALLMPNRPDYVAIWLGLSQIGCVVALLNTNLATDALSHSIKSAGARHVIVDGALAARLPKDVRAWPDLVQTVRGLSGAPLATHQRRTPRPADRALYIYTSGTTGLPKAATVTHARVLEWSGWFAGMMDALPEDRLFDCLPLYHSVGGVVAVGSMLVAGGSVVIRERFSASRFWGDVAASGSTIIQYIGELCRYLAQSTEADDKIEHKVRLACGNGLAGDVWERFQQRFRIPRILEFYAATEGGVSLTNCEGMPGAIGHVPKFLAHRFPVALIRVDPETSAPVRDAAGRCTRATTDEPGEAIGKLAPAAARFDGYTDSQATEAKILRDVFEPGDRWFRSGDLMRQDAAGYYYFLDRLGDTFRWKGENVATTEVAAVLRACPGVVDAAVYGVAVAGNDGKAGMAALVTDAAFDLTRLHAYLAEKLPGYARPMFVRLTPALDTTGTFRLQKAELAREGYLDSRDPVWVEESKA
ncbi:MAG TPA: long-chain-acyl-CoA synthetase, partial [Reyranella sp.]|nr:long-chain-acyl-CoA synthetase [Reyranella sp.]